MIGIDLTKQLRCRSREINFGRERDETVQSETETGKYRFIKVLFAAIGIFLRKIPNILEFHIDQNLLKPLIVIIFV